MSSVTDKKPAAVAPDFDAAVADSGYRWWYVDGISDDGRNSIVVIAFVGSVFSPYYFRARQRGPTDPENFCAINVGLYQPTAKLWAMTERGASALRRGANWFQVGPSSLEWRGNDLEITINERSMPFARRIRGKILMRPEVANERTFELDSGGQHSWQPLAPSGRIEVQLDSPNLSWHGNGYFDTNVGKRALEDDFSCWDWSRGKIGDSTSISYAVTQVDGVSRSLAMQFDRSTGCTEVEVPLATPLSASGWRIARTARTSGNPCIARTLEDTPFYARSMLTVNNTAGSHLLMHESLDMNRFAARWVRLLLPFRMPRIARERH